VRLATPQQISVGTSVTLNNSGLLELTNIADAIGSLAGNGHVGLNGAAANLSVGFDNVSTIFNGLISGSGGFAKVRTGTLLLNGNNTYSGQTRIDGGRLIVNGSQPASSVTVNSLGLLGGTGRVGNLSGAGTVSPGLSPGILSCSQVTFSSNTTFQIELNGPSPGASYDQLSADNVTLAGTLVVTLGFSPATNDSFTIINNVGSAPVVGTFNGLPEGSLLVVGQTQFQIGYASGSDSNDVVLTVVSALPRPTLSLIILSDGSAQISGTGQTGHVYVIESATSLAAPVSWTPLATNTVDASGTFQFTDTNAVPSLVRFYRLSQQ